MKLRPYLKIKGEIKGIGEEITLGSSHEINIWFIIPFIGSDVISHSLIAGGYYTIILNPQTIPPLLLKNRRENLQNTFNAGKGYKDDILGEMLFVLGLTYFMECDFFQELAEASLKIVNISQISEAMMATSLGIDYLFGIPANVKVGGYFLDAARAVDSPFSKTGDKEAQKNFMLITGMINSALEHSIFEQSLNLSSVSAVKILQIANQLAIPIFTINTQNIRQILPALKVSSCVKEDIQNSVNAGKIVTIPKQEIILGGWSGTGYIVLDSDTGGGAYLISGGLAGGNGEADKVNKEMIETLLNFVADVLIAILENINTVVSKVLEVCKVIVEVFIGIVEGKLTKREAFVYCLVWFVLNVSLILTAGIMFWVAITQSLPIFAICILVGLGLFITGLVMVILDMIKESLETSRFQIRIRQVLVVLPGNLLEWRL